MKQVVGNLGFALNSQSFGIRVKPTELSAVRSLVAPTKFSAPNLSVRGSMRYTITGLPSGCSRSEMVKRFAEWNWPVIPLEHWISGGQSHWLVGCDKAPPKHFYLMRTCRALIEGAQEISAVLWGLDPQNVADQPRLVRCRSPCASLCSRPQRVLAVKARPMPLFRLPQTRLPMMTSWLALLHWKHTRNCQSNVRRRWRRRWALALLQSLPGWMLKLTVLPLLLAAPRRAILGRPAS